jgi:hypothetical protein
LFSHDSVANFINGNFEPVWVSVRPVPVVRIDFGNGTVLTRTLHGNILTSVCTADGLVLDALPGIYAEDVYLDRLEQLRLLARYTQGRPVALRAALVRDYHLDQARALARNVPPQRFVEKQRIAAITKAKIERPVEVVLQSPAQTPPAAEQQARAPAANPPPDAGEDVSHWQALAEDTRLNESTRRRQIHELLADVGVVRPDRVTRPIYKDVLHADLDDPYLGLGKTLFATYPFAREDQER